tara:strand:+ start:1740 stop:2672 length:933 start_codon:yes stop_codon:yes gene_type:complete
MNHGGVTRARSLWGLLGTLAFAWSAAAAGQQLGSALEHSAWAVRGDNQACVLEHAVPGYGTGRFRHEAGADRTFGLVSDDLRFDVGTLIVAAEPPPWRPHLAGSRLADLKYEGDGIAVDAAVASRMLTSLTRGYDVQLAGPLQHSVSGRVRVRLSATRFEPPYREFVACEAQLLPASFAQIERLRITYASGVFVVPASLTQKLERISVYVGADPTVTRVYVDGHTDDRGLVRDNVSMSRKRAEMVTRYLVAAGVPNDMIVTRYHGSKYPAVPNTNERNRGLNRRTTVRLTKEPIVEAIATVPALDAQASP